jgi:hypothetical protein
MCRRKSTAASLDESGSGTRDIEAMGDDDDDIDVLLTSK